MYFLMISAATKQHFVSDRYPAGMYLISTLSLVGLFAFLGHAFLGTLTYTFGPLGMMLVAAGLFVWAVKHSRARNLSLAFDQTLRNDGIITTGPWRHVRHPFYISYVLFWVACAIGTLHVASIAVCATLLFIYIYSAREEERQLRQGAHGDAYLEYSKQAGFFLPRLVSRG